MAYMILFFLKALCFATSLSVYPEELFDERSFDQPKKIHEFGYFQEKPSMPSEISEFPFEKEKEHSQSNEKHDISLVTSGIAESSKYVPATENENINFKEYKLDQNAVKGELSRWLKPKKYKMQKSENIFPGVAYVIQPKEQEILNHEHVNEFAEKKQEQDGFFPKHTGYPKAQDIIETKFKKIKLENTKNNSADLSKGSKISKDSVTKFEKLKDSLGKEYEKEVGKESSTELADKKRFGDIEELDSLEVKQPKIHLSQMASNEKPSIFKLQMTNQNQSGILLDDPRHSPKESDKGINSEGLKSENDPGISGGLESESNSDDSEGLKSENDSSISGGVESESDSDDSKGLEPENNSNDSGGLKYETNSDDSDILEPENDSGDSEDLKSENNSDDLEFEYLTDGIDQVTEMNSHFAKESWKHNSMVEVEPKEFLPEPMSKDSKAQSDEKLNESKKAKTDKIQILTEEKENDKFEKNIYEPERIIYSPKIISEEKMVSGVENENPGKDDDLKFQNGYYDMKSFKWPVLELETVLERQPGSVVAIQSSSEEEKDYDKTIESEIGRTILDSETSVGENPAKPDYFKIKVPKTMTVETMKNYHGPNNMLEKLEIVDKHSHENGWSAPLVKNTESQENVFLKSDKRNSKIEMNTKTLKPFQFYREIRQYFNKNLLNPSRKKTGANIFTRKEQESGFESPRNPQLFKQEKKLRDQTSFLKKFKTIQTVSPKVIKVLEEKSGKLKKILESFNRFSTQCTNEKDLMKVPIIFKLVKSLENESKQLGNILEMLNNFVAIYRNMRDISKELLMTFRLVNPGLKNENKGFGHTATAQTLFTKIVSYLTSLEAKYSNIQDSSLETIVPQHRVDIFMSKLPKHIGQEQFDDIFSNIRKLINKKTNELKMYSLSKTSSIPIRYSKEDIKKQNFNEEQRKINNIDHEIQNPIFRSILDSFQTYSLPYTILNSSPSINPFANFNRNSAVDLAIPSNKAVGERRSNEHNHRITSIDNTEKQKTIPISRNFHPFSNPYYDNLNRNYGLDQKILLNKDIEVQAAHEKHHKIKINDFEKKNQGSISENFHWNSHPYGNLNRNSAVYLTLPYKKAISWQNTIGKQHKIYADNREIQKPWSISENFHYDSYPYANSNRNSAVDHAVLLNKAVEERNIHGKPHRINIDDHAIRKPGPISENINRYGWPYRSFEGPAVFKIPLQRAINAAKMHEFYSENIPRKQMEELRNGNLQLETVLENFHRNSWPYKSRVNHPFNEFELSSVKETQEPKIHERPNKHAENVENSLTNDGLISFG